MKTMLTIALICLPLSTLYAQANVPPAAEREILRRGNLVEHVGGDTIGDATAIAEAMRPPADDSHKWFVSIVSTDGCRYCVALERDFASSPHLLAFANPHDYKASWSHFNVFRANDATQKWRWKNVKLVGYPTILVQPPRSGDYGDPRTIVWQKTGYDGDAEKLAAGLRAAISNYAVRQHQVRQSAGETVPAPNDGIVPAVTGGFEQAATEPQAIADEQPVGNGQRQPPFTPPSRIEPPPYYPPNNPQQFPFDFPPTNPDALPQIDLLSLVGTLIGRLTGGSGTTNLLLAVLAALAGVRTFRKQQNVSENSSNDSALAARKTRTTK